MLPITPYQNFQTYNKNLNSSQIVTATHLVTRKKNTAASFSSSLIVAGGALTGAVLGYQVYKHQIATTEKILDEDPNGQNLKKMLAEFKELEQEYSEDKVAKITKLFGEDLGLDNDPVLRNKDIKEYIKAIKGSLDEVHCGLIDKPFKMLKRKLIVYSSLAGLATGILAVGIKHLILSKKSLGANDANNKK